MSCEKSALSCHHSRKNMFKIAWRNEGNCSTETMNIPEVKGCVQLLPLCCVALVSPVVFVFIIFFKDRDQTSTLMPF